MNAKRYPPLGQTSDFSLLRVTDRCLTNWMYIFFGNFAILLNCMHV